MRNTVFVGGTVFYPEEFLGCGRHSLECVLYPSAEADCLDIGELTARLALHQALATCDTEVRRSQIGLTVLIVWYPAFRPCRLEFGACEAAHALWKCFGIPVDVLPAAVSVC